MDRDIGLFNQNTGILKIGSDLDEVRDVIAEINEYPFSTI
jgi:hypothetical protein